jgi:rSAM/selenodomain-associated transferase 1
MTRRLLVFARAPLAGSVKTRLVPPLTPEQAVRVHIAALRDTVSRAARAVTDTALEVWAGGNGAEAAERIAALVPGRTVRRQGEGDLGARLAGAFAVAFESGGDRVAVLGSDHPTLPAAHIAAAFDALDVADAALGPSDDGGYYAVALRRATWPRARALFDRIPWSSADVLKTTRDRARGVALSVADLPAWYDVDDVNDLERAFRDAEPGSDLARLLDEPDFAAFRPAHA